MVPRHGDEATQRRRVWEQRWQEQEGTEFVWHLDDVPEQLPWVLDRWPPPPGTALDLGCGAGVSTAFLARRFRLVVGLDIALGAVEEARRLLEGGEPAGFVVADAAILPYRDRSVSFIFDRGCLQNLPKAAWRPYFAEVDRLLAPSGVLQLLCSKGTPRQLPPVLSRRGVRVRAKRFLGRGGTGGGPQFLSHGLLTRLAPSSLEVLAMEDFPFATAKGHHRTFTHAVFRRGASIARG